MNPSDSKILEGGCLCGAIRYRITRQPTDINYCHCGQCRRHSGAPVAAIATFPAADVVWTKGQPRLFASSAIGRRGFCPDCGTSLTWQGVQTPQEIDLGVGTFDDASSFRPKDHIWTESAIPWFHVDDHLPRYKRSRKEG
jgi:hypothetical protein